MIPVPGMSRVRSHDSTGKPSIDEQESRELEGEEQDDQSAKNIAPPRRSATLERGAPPPVPKGKDTTVPQRSAFTKLAREAFANCRLEVTIPRIIPPLSIPHGTNSTQIQLVEARIPCLYSGNLNF